MTDKSRKDYSFKKGNITVPIYRTEYRKKDRVYVTFLVSDYTTGKRKLWAFADLARAKEKAGDVADRFIKGQAIKSFEASLRVQILDALEAVRPTGVSILRAAEMFSQAVTVLGGHDQILSACAYWKEHGPRQDIEARTVSDAAKEYFLHRHWISPQRLKTETFYFSALSKHVDDTLISHLKGVEIEDFLKSRKWGPKTTNDFLTALHGLYKHAQERRWTLPQHDPTRVIKRRKEPRNMVVIFEPWEVRQIFNRLPTSHPDLVPFAALWFFSGARKEEIGRMTWAQVNRGLKTGEIELEAEQTKSRAARLVPISPNLRAWLVAYQKESGSVLPPHWMQKIKSAENRLGEITRILAKASGIIWKFNGPRHSYATFRFKLTKDPAIVVDAMGTSLAKFERHYRSKSKVVTEDAAKEYFEIAPERHDKIVPLPPSITTSEPDSSALRR